MYIVTAVTWPHSSRSHFIINKCCFQEIVKITMDSIMDNIADIPPEGFVDDSTNSSVFYFESDHLALKGNQDYLQLMKTLAHLEAIKVQTIQDLDLLYAEKKRALRNPTDLCEKLRSGEIILPGLLRIPEVPAIDWSRYNLTEEVTKRPLKRTTKQAASEAAAAEDRPQDVFVRGRVYRSDKPQTFNQPWREEEQRRLEELLDTFPTEEIEMERWKKIASELGNRTPVQVQSRVQKYFLKLQRAGLPIPGRAPPSRSKNRYLKPAVKKKFAKQPILSSTKKSTFLTSVVPTVRMDDCEVDYSEGPLCPESEEEAGEELDGEGDKQKEEDGDEELSAEARSSEEYKVLQVLTKVKGEAESELMNGTTEHQGFRCDHCSASPLLGTRWHCQTCEQDFCNDCLLESDHNLLHPFSLTR